MSLLNNKENEKMTKKVIVFRLLMWSVGAVLVLVSGLLFSHDNEAVWNITRYYNETVIILSLIPVAQITLIVDMTRTKKQILRKVLTMGFVFICFLIYIGTWIMCTGGV